MLCSAALAALGLGTAGCAGAESQSSGDAAPSTPIDLGSADAVPVGGAKLYAEEQILVSQPGKGEFKAFSAVCTHQGAKLSKVENGTADCPLHGSRFSVETGEVEHGPATAPLPEIPVDVTEDGKLVTDPGKAG
ncbi:Rieske (2Fe-2S) protein [Streptomyces xiaopingdaonensis]|uniref:Rieske (2Fe-2S) protein n=1 Tax=Streptomyces xiaopingdaonensis TaxID=1565415 RepID=UPI0002D7F17F|nr:Rieske (2Fe-2S) protein [Streptomyces xiaopingdaonensis]